MHGARRNNPDQLAVAAQRETDVKQLGLPKTNTSLIQEASSSQLHNAGISEREPFVSDRSIRLGDQS